MNKDKMPEYPDLENIPVAEREDALEAWSKAMLEERIRWENRTMGKLNKQDHINCDYCRNRGWVSVLQAVQWGKRTHYTTATKPCHCRYNPFGQGGSNNG